MGRKITVNGTASISLAPDTTVLDVTINGEEKTYQKALEKSSDSVEALVEAFKKIGFSGEDLKTSSFRIDPHYEGYQDEKGRWVNKLDGYEFHHSFTVQFKSDVGLLGKCLAALAESSARPQFSIRYTVADQSKVKDQLLKLAVKNSKKKAELLCKAAGVKLGEIDDISYSFRGVPVYSFTEEAMPAMDMAMGASAKMAARNMSITPQDIEVSDTVTISWEIE